MRRAIKVCDAKRFKTSYWARGAFFNRDASNHLNRAEKSRGASFRRLKRDAVRVLASIFHFETRNDADSMLISDAYTNGISNAFVYAIANAISYA